MDTIYYGTKKLKAKLMTRQGYCDYRGWTLPDDEDGEDLGYLVEYLDGGKANDERHEGYISWSPEAVFKAAYQPNGTLNFGHALAAIKDGKRLARQGWNGKGMFVFLVASSKFKVSREPLISIFEEGKEITYRPHIDICQPDGAIGVWQPSMGDVMAEDWYIVGGEKKINR